MSKTNRSKSVPMLCTFKDICPYQVVLDPGDPKKTHTYTKEDLNNLHQMFVHWKDCQEKDYAAANRLLEFFVHKFAEALGKELQE